MVELHPSISLSELYKHLSELERIGNRWPGSEGESKAQEYIYSYLKSLALDDVFLDEFEFLQYEPVRFELDLKSPVTDKIVCRPMSYTENASVSGEVVYVGSGSPEEFRSIDEQGIEIGDKIVMATTDIPFEITPLVEERGGIALIAVSNAPESLIRNCVGKLYPPAISNPERHKRKIPGVMISRGAGNKILLLKNRGNVEAKITHEGKYNKSESKNVVGVQNGKGGMEESVVVGGHYDTQLEGTGIWDNGTGVVGVLDFARAFSNLSSERTIMFVAFGCEEVGLWGSESFVRKREKEIKNNCRGMVTLDTVSTSLCPNNTIWANNQAMEMAIEKASQLKWPVHYTSDLSISFSDYAPFNARGVPAMWIFEYPPIHPYYHTAKDKIEFIDFVKCRSTLQVNAACLTAMAETKLH